MSSLPLPGPSQPPLNMDCSDIANAKGFMDALITFMNESAYTIQQVKERAGISPGCSAPVRMNDEEKKQKMNDIILNLSEQYSTEASSLYATADESVYQTALDPSAYESMLNEGFSLPSTPSKFRPPAASTPYPSPPYATPPRQSPRGRRADTPRPGTTPVRGRVATPDQYFVPLAQSSAPPSPSACPASPSFTRSRSGARGGGRSQSPYSTLVDSGGAPYAYRSGAPAFESTSQSGRGLSNYSNYPSSGYAGPPAAGAWSNLAASGFGGSDCPPECSIGSANSTGRQQYRNLKGGQNNWDWKQENRTV